MRTLNRNKTHSLTEGSIWKSLLLFAVPIMLSNLFQQLYNTIDSAVVGLYAGDLALAAVGSTGALIQLLVGFFLGIATGAGVLYGTYYGAKDPVNMRRVGGGAMLMSVVAGAVLTLVGVLWSPQMLRLMGTPDDVMGHATVYLRIYFTGMIPMLVYNVGAGLIRAAGDSTKPLIYLVISGVLNLILDIAFVAGLKMGVAGAAWATVISQAVSAVLVCLHLAKGPEIMRMSLRDIRLSKNTAIQLGRISLPCGVQSSMFNIANLLVQAKINSFGSVAMAGVAAYCKIDGFVYMPMMALSLAVSTFASQNVGAGKLDRVKKGAWVSVIMGICVSVCIATVVVIFCPKLLHAFTNSEEVIAQGVKMMWFMAPFAWTFSFSDMLGGAMRGAGAVTQVTVITAICICVFRIIWLTVMLGVWNDIRIVYLCYPTSWLLSSVCILIYYFKGQWLKPMEETI